MNDWETVKVPGSAAREPHLQNFFHCIKSGKRPAADVDDGHKSTMLGHLGNIAYRTNSTLKCDPKTGRILGNKEASALWGREYRKGWEAKV